LVTVGLGSSAETSLFASFFEIGIISGSKTGVMATTGGCCYCSGIVTLSGSGALTNPFSFVIVCYEKKISATSANLMLAETWLRTYYF
jgi:hypothetical protein